MFARIGVLSIVAALLAPSLPGDLDRHLGDGVGLVLLVYGVVLAGLVVAELSGVRFLRVADRE